MIINRTLLLLGGCLLFSVARSGAQTKYYEQKTDYTPAYIEAGRTDSIAFKRKRFRFEPLQFEDVGKGWIKVANNGFSGPQFGYMKMSDVDSYIHPKRLNGQEFAAYKIVADSVVMVSEIGGLSETFYKGDILPIAREYPDYYAICYDYGDSKYGLENIFFFASVANKRALRPTDQKYSESRTMDLAAASYKLAPELGFAREKPFWRKLPKRVRNGIVALVIAAVIGLYFLIERWLFYNRRISNGMIDTYSIVGSAAIAIGGIWYFWEHVSGWGALGLIVGAIVFFFIFSRLGLSLDKRCEHCHMYPAPLRLIGVEKGDIVTTQTTDRKSRTEHTKTDKGDIETITDQRHHHTDSYQSEWYTIYCDNCSHGWAKQIRGEHIGRLTRTNTTITEITKRRVPR